MLEQNVELVQKMYEYFGQGDMGMLRDKVLSSDIVWKLPGRHPLAGSKQGINEVLAFLDQLVKSGLQVEILKMHSIEGNRVVDHHRVYGEKAGVSIDVLTATVYKIKDGKIFEVSDYVNDQHAIDRFFNIAYTLKPIPERLLN